MKTTMALLSGGLDSATVLAMIVPRDEVVAVGFDYGQPHKVELERAAEIAAHYGVPFDVVKLPTMPRVDPVVVAGRNLVLAGYAVALAQASGLRQIAVGCNASDWMRFPDCRPPFWKALGDCAAAYDVRVLTPLLHSPKSDVVNLARSLGVPIDRTWSCYSPRDGEPCGECLACTTRREALA